MVKFYPLLAVLLALVLALAFFPFAAAAQSSAEPTGLKNVTLWIYPEYDDPRVLVMIEGKISGANLPAPIRFLVPQSAEMYSAGGKDANGVYTGGPPERKASQTAGWDEISYQLKYETFRVEYYYPGISGQPDKQISFDYHWLYPLAGLRVVVQQPLKASGFSVTPGGQAGTEDQFKVVTFSHNNLTPEQTIQYDIKYTKADSAPSLGVPTPLPTSGSASSGKWWVWLIVVAAVLVVGSSMILLARSKATARGGRSGDKAPARNTLQVSKTGTRRGRFCNYCGKPIGENANFCGECGKKVGK